MADNRIPSQWQLQETGETRDEWMLHEDEQRLPDHMQLQEEARPVTPESAWQPIDYRAMQQAAARPRNRGGATLGTLVVLALLGAAGYMTWFYFGNSGAAAPTEEAAATAAAPDDAQQAADSASVDSAAAEVSAAGAGAAAAGAAPEAMSATPGQAAVPITASVEIPLPTPTPSPVTLNEATVTEEYGVNARRDPRSDSDLLQVVEKGVVLLIASGPIQDAEGGSWYEVVLPDKVRGWVSAQFVTVAGREVVREEAEKLLTAAGLEALLPPLVVAEPVVADIAQGGIVTDVVAVDGSRSVTASGVLTGAGESATGIAAGADLTDTTSTPVVAAAPITVSATISAPAGLNLRREPQSGDNVIQLLAHATALSIIGRSADGEWVQVQTPDGTRGWLATSFVSVGGDIDAIPLGTTQPLTPTAPLVAPTPLVQQAVIPTATAAPALIPTATPSAFASQATTSTAASAASIGLPTPTPAAAAPAATPVLLTPAADGSVGTLSVSSVLGVNVRPAPSQDSQAVAQLKWNDTAQVLGRSADSAWVKIRLADGRTGWVASSAVSIPAGLAALPVLQ